MWVFVVFLLLLFVVVHTPLFPLVLGVFSHEGEIAACVREGRDWMSGMGTALDASDQAALTRMYVKQHKLNEIFAHFLQLLIYHKPENPRAFLQREIRLMIATKTSTPLFGEQDLETMFDLIDVTKQRWVTVSQLRNTCKNLATAAGEGSIGLSPAQEEAIEHAADEEGHVSVEKFKEVLAMQLLTRDIWKD
ncbi:hypothetical protein, conserved [Trypanosoma cruzi]|uniref:EF-hand domain-containing protein n=2 Tax=Trypanosoma cruzi TaxID=5693 RepID=Q4DWC6_TRYCC|nr:hypothetical protein, conserved [Trypanosoma cruzi]EAN96818.1 hypothetical protein, conserved [Trypanosoma cruzi]|eukprot:XP_818669.1 hypothetical protein [Trypanosoma cruzi strain CL Brener]